MLSHLAGFVVGVNWPPPWGIDPPHWVSSAGPCVIQHLWRWTLAGWR